MPLKRVAVNLRHVRRTATGKEARDVLERIIELEGDLSPEQRQSLLVIAERCPVSRTLRRGAEIASSLA
jgi:putative redox protein